MSESTGTFYFSPLLSISKLRAISCTRVVRTVLLELTAAFITATRTTCSADCTFTRLLIFSRPFDLLVVLTLHDHAWKHTAQEAFLAISLLVYLHASDRRQANKKMKRLRKKIRIFVDFSPSCFYGGHHNSLFRF